MKFLASYLLLALISVTLFGGSTALPQPEEVETIKEPEGLDSGSATLDALTSWFTTRILEPTRELVERVSRNRTIGDLVHITRNSTNSLVDRVGESDIIQYIANNLVQPASDAVNSFYERNKERTPADLAVDLRQSISRLDQFVAGTIEDFTEDSSEDSN